MSQDSPIDTRVAAQLSRLLPRFEERLITKGFSGGVCETFLELPPTSDADYHFRLFFEPEMQIYANLLGTDQEHYFWYMPFEQAAYGGDLDKLCTAFVSTVETLICHSTRIIQKSGLLFHSFSLECEREGRWQRVYGMSCLRSAFKVPPIRGRQHVYFSSPVAWSETP